MGGGDYLDELSFDESATNEGWPTERVIRSPENYEHLIGHLLTRRLIDANTAYEAITSFQLRYDERQAIEDEVYGTDT